MIEGINRANGHDTSHRGDSCEVCKADAARDAFHAHLDHCDWCDEHPFSLCALGGVLLATAGQAIARELGDAIRGV